MTVRKTAVAGGGRRTAKSAESFISRAIQLNIKELNAQRQSREVRMSRNFYLWYSQETLRKAEEIFGMDNKDLYISFQELTRCTPHYLTFKHGYETLRKAEEIFGMDNKELYISFQELLNRSMH
ncbi:protein kinase superfamily protein [Striga asiatica]|uniref:Protein kinase superfamily protein n=1 Tax=Striga asiatica TaxID=4170 RepID=A0A5A7QBS0_STRAF|nr:protein kinase superfamily protein [Striga asiatica]